MAATTAGVLAGVALATTVGGTLYAESQKEEPKSAEKLNKEAELDAERKRLATEKGKATKGKTMFSDPLVAGGAPLKQDLGA